MEDYTDLAGAIEARGHDLAAQTVRAACSGAFWDERFGERGRRHAANDAGYHVQYLVSALRLRTPSVLTGYARWLQGILTPRGMCTLHIEEHFRALSGAVSEQGIPGADTASAYLEEAIAALRYNAGPSRAVQDAADGLVDEAWRLLAERHPGWREAPGESRVRADLRFLLSYLADAVALNRAEVFGSYIAWIGPFRRRHGAPPGHVGELLGALEAGTLPEGARDVILAARAVV
jgi:hypothetical protein